MQGTVFSFTTVACRRSFNMHRKCPRGELSQSSQAAVSSHHLSVLPSPGKPLQSQSKRLEGGYNDTGEGTTVCIESKWYRGKEKPAQIFSEEVTYWAFYSLLRVMERLQFVPQPGVFGGAWVVFSCFLWPGSGFKVMWFLQTCWLLKEEKQTRQWLHDLSPSLGDFQWSHLESPIPSPHQGTNHLTPNPGLPHFLHCTRHHGKQDLNASGSSLNSNKA